MKIIVHYPPVEGHVALRTDADWDADIPADAVSADGTAHEFTVEPQSSYLYFKPVLVRDARVHWARGNNYLALRHLAGDREIWPYFVADEHCNACEVKTLTDESSGADVHYRVFHPPGYAENTLKRYPVLYLQDGQNVFFRDDARDRGHDWRLDETLTRLADMNAVDKVIAVGVYSDDGHGADGHPRGKDYGRFLATALKPHIDRDYRTLPGPDHTAIMGSSVGGVAAFQAAWGRPDVFGSAACLSSAFGWRDDLAGEVARRPKRAVRFYLDSGWPYDNYEVTRDMRALLASRGWVEGRDLFYFAFPDAHHDEHSWAMRCHIPIQIFFGRRHG